MSDLLKERGESALANLIYKHKFIRILDPKEKPQTWEEILVYYADKRVMHDQKVTLEERFRDGHVRNRHLIKDLEESKRACEAVRKLEAKIFQALSK